MRYYNTGRTDSWDRPIWNDENGEKFVDINIDRGKILLHDVTSEGEPNSLIEMMDRFESYQEMKRRHEKEVNAFPMGFAFSQKQLKEECERLGVENPRQELVSIGAGGFIKKADMHYYMEMTQRIGAELDKAMQNDSFLIGAIRYELGNHEYCYTGDPTDTLEVLGITLEEERVRECFQIAKKLYLKDSEGWM